MTARTQVSIVIISYNSRDFLHICLLSVFNTWGVDKFEVIVVDNHSSDGSVQHIRHQFPNVILLVNEQNVGFGRACNQGADAATGEYLLFLNPDTIIPEDAIRLCVDRAKKLEKAGGVGAVLIDGSGRVLKESARNIPGIWNTAAKVLGFSEFAGKLYPRLAYYANPKNNRPLILPGAFFLIRSSVFNEIGRFDESFFMYGEDIDLSYRLISSGFINSVVEDCCVIHFKGESTHKASRSYLSHFYGAFENYARKHGLLNTWLRKSVVPYALTFMKWRKWTYQHVRPWLKALVHGVVLWLIFVACHLAWAFVYHRDPHYFPSPDYFFNGLWYAILFIITFFWNGLYLKRDPSLYSTTKAIVYAVILSILVYGLVPENLRFSRMALLLSGLFTWISFSFISWLRGLGVHNKNKHKEIFYITDLTDYKQDLAFFEDRNMEVTHVLPSQDALSNEFLKSASKIIFDADNHAFRLLIRLVQLRGQQSEIILYDRKGKFLLSSVDSRSPGKVIRHILSFAIEDPVNDHQKRYFDVVMALILLLISPIFILMSASSRILKNLMKVLSGEMTMVSYMDNQPEGTPDIRKGFIEPLSDFRPGKSSFERSQSLEEYARNYHVMKDVIWCMLKLTTLLKALAWKN